MSLLAIWATGFFIGLGMTLVAAAIVYAVTPPEDDPVGHAAPIIVGGALVSVLWHVLLMLAVILLPLAGAFLGIVWLTRMVQEKHATGSMSSTTHVIIPARWRRIFRRG
ncbi:hypothetical protein LCGC14_1818240 [marine sediment metagenome]|uniref:Uncharacterized protein n=1 Tax=marine sediment metagenome TaxID=412755 RepID=A0A0F9IZG7_9ZZZZ